VSTAEKKAVRFSKQSEAVWHAVDVRRCLDVLQVDAAHGLTDLELESRRARYGRNELVERGVKSFWLILWEQLTAFLVLILIVAAVISGAIGEWVDSVAILVIVVLNALLGLSQEYRAEKAMAALKRMAVPTVRVRRNGETLEISAKDLLPGDIVILEAGNHVPADGRLIEAVNLKVQEAALTGESEPVEKNEAPLPEGAALADRRNMSYLGTDVTYGRGVMVVTAIGMNTELGRIADMLQSVRRDPTPLQRRLDELGKVLSYVALAIIAVVVGVELFRGVGIKTVFLTAVSMAVAAVPEGLPAVVTISLALGAQRMLRRRVLIRKLTAVETLGSVTMICSDKTGTLTENRMTVVALEFPGKQVDFRKGLDAPDLTTLMLLGGSALANDAVLKTADSRTGAYTTLGDPTEGALVIAAAGVGLLKPDLDRVLPRVGEAPFDSSRKRMTTVHTAEAKPAAQPLDAFLKWIAGVGAARVAFTKGSVDGLLAVSDRVWLDDHVEPLTADMRAKIDAGNERMAGDGVRVLGLAFKPVELEGPYRPDALEKDLVFVGMVGMIDPLRREVPGAVQTCRAAGIQPMMITGDHPLTARYIARELGMMTEDGLLTGQRLDALSDDEFQEATGSVRVYARVTPEHKLRIVEALQAKGQVVAMTGDGVNDAPALKKANIGVAMGITGTDVSKEASDMVLQDDNFATIVAAVEEGRVIYDNIRRFVRYILATNSGELWVMLGGPFLGITLPLLPLQILWMNLVTDGLPALALAVEPAERDVMRRPPRRPDEGIIGRRMGIHVLWVGMLMGVVTLGAGYYYKNLACPSLSWPTVQTMIFTIVVLLQLGNALAVRSVRDSIFRQGFLSNPALLISIAAMVALQLAIIYVPFCQGIFKTAPLSAWQLLVTLTLGTTVFWAVEFEKWLTRLVSRNRVEP
jgi:Ca2+-transporting ATPase